jgi:hypothetical protein
MPRATQCITDGLSGDFNFYKFDFRVVQQFNHKNETSTQIILEMDLLMAMSLLHIYTTHIQIM